MKVYLNERSICGQAADPDNAMVILSQLAKLVVKSQPIASEGKSYRTRCFEAREITPGISVREILTSSVIAQTLKFKTERNAVLQILMRRPFTEDRHIAATDSISSANGECLKSSCIDDAAGSLSGSMLLSASGSPCSNDDIIHYTSSIYGKGASLNLCSEESLENRTWRFEHNAKHRSTPRKSDGEDISEMDLTQEQAQRTLSNGIMVKSRVYGYCDGSWYQFHCHTNNIYHGFKINLETNNTAHNTAHEKLTAIGLGFNCGQVFIFETES